MIKLLSAKDARGKKISSIEFTGTYLKCVLDDGILLLRFYLSGLEYGVDFEFDDDDEIDFDEIDIDDLQEIKYEVITNIDEIPEEELELLKLDIISDRELRKLPKPPYEKPNGEYLNPPVE